MKGLGAAVSEGNVWAVRKVFNDKSQILTLDTENSTKRSFHTGPFSDVTHLEFFLH